MSTLVADGLAQGQVLTSAMQNVPVGTIGDLGPIPPSADTVATGNYFDIAVLGYDVTGPSSKLVVNDAAFLIGPFSAAFGGTETVTGATRDGETATITSLESSTQTTTTDKITVSVPSRFVPIGSTFTDGDIIDEEDLEIGLVAGSQGLTFTYPVNTTITASGTASYGPTTGKKQIYTFSAAHGSAPYVHLDGSHTILSADEGLDSIYVDYSAADITHYNISSFSFSFAFATPPVPEPAAGVMGLLIGAGLLKRHSRDKRSPIVPLSTGLVDEPGEPTASGAPSPEGVMRPVH